VQEMAGRTFGGKVDLRLRNINPGDAVLLCDFYVGGIARSTPRSRTDEPAPAAQQFPEPAQARPLRLAFEAA